MAASGWRGRFQVAAGSGPRGTHDGELVIALGFGPVLGFGLERGQGVGPDIGTMRYVCPFTTVRSPRSTISRKARRSGGPGLRPSQDRGLPSGSPV